MAGTRGGEPGSRRLAQLLASLFAAASILALNTCGIDTPVTIFSPPSFSLPSPNELVLIHNTANNSAGGFSGYEIYYQAFDTDAAASNAEQYVEAATALVSATPEYCNNVLMSHGYTRICDAAGNDGVGGLRPLFRVSTAEQTAGTAVEFDLFLDSTSTSTTPPNATWYYTKSTSPTTQVQVTRSISSPGVSPVSFEDSYSNGNDYKGAGSAARSPIYFVFFAVAFGMDVSSSSFAYNYSLPASFYQRVNYIVPPL